MVAKHQIAELTSLKRHMLKILALLFSTLVWIYVLNSEPMEVLKTMDVAITPPQGEMVSNLLDTRVAVTLKGPRAFIRTMKEGPLKIFLKIPPDGKSPYDLEILDESIKLPFGVTVKEIRPRKLMIETEREIKKYVPIVLDVAGDLNENVQKDFELSSPKVLIAGPHSIMKKTAKVLTETVLVSELSGNGKLTLALVKSDPRMVFLENDHVEFHYKLRSKISNMMINDVSIRFLSTKRKFNSRVTKASVSLLVPLDRIKTMDKEQVEVMADIPNDKTGLIQVPLDVHLPEGIYLEKVYPQKIEVNIK